MRMAILFDHKYLSCGRIMIQFRWGMINFKMAMLRYDLVKLSQCILVHHFCYFNDESSSRPDYNIHPRSPARIVQWFTMQVLCASNCKRRLTGVAKNSRHMRHGLWIEGATSNPREVIRKGDQAFI